jgi:transcriptional regulator with XRE-family HTH domain
LNKCCQYGSIAAVHNESAAIGAEIRAHLGRQGKSLRWLAAAMGVNNTTLSRRVRGDRGFTIDEMTHIARLLGVKVTDLMPLDSVGAA